MVIMIMTALCVFITVAIMNIHHHPPARSIPAWLRSLVFGYMIPLICWNLPCYLQGTDWEDQRKGVTSPAHTQTSVHGTQNTDVHKVAQLSNEHNPKDWKDLLCILERVLFYIFLLIGVILFLILFHG